MSATTSEPKGELLGSAPARRPIPRLAWVLLILAVWLVGWLLLNGTHTLAISGREQSGLQLALGEFRDAILASRDTNPLVRFTYALGKGFSNLVEKLQGWVSIADFPRPVPQVGWLGVTAVATWVGYAVANWRIALLVLGSFLSFGAFGYWSESIDLLIVTGISVAAVILIGMPLAVWAGTNVMVNRVLTVFLDLMQTMPTFVYLLPIVLFFGVSASAAVVCTLIYALPPLIRIAAFGISEVSPTAIEATDSVGQTGFQRLLKVQLPMARKTIIVGLNQSIMAALSMATLASYVDGPGLGRPVLAGLVRGDFGGAFVPGALIVVIAIMLDRTTTAASERGEIVARGGGPNPLVRRVVLFVGAVLAGVAVWWSRQSLAAAEWGDTGWGRSVANVADEAMRWVVGILGGVAGSIKDTITFALLNPMQALLAESPWWLVILALTMLALVIAGWQAALIALLCLLPMVLLGRWNAAMITLNMTLVATVLVMVLAVIFGVWMARSPRADLIIRPILDAGQTIPAFVYLLPVLALFGPNRFSAIAAGIVYAAPAAIKLVADGVRGLPEGVLEASRSTGQTTWQEIIKVQLPMAKGSLVVAANQGLLYVLAMAVIGGMVGAGALGYDVVLGFARSEEWGRGAAAGLTIVLLGVMLDRVARASAERH